MSTPTITLQPALHPDLEALINNLQASKLSLTINRVLWTQWPNLACQRPQYIKAITTSFNDENIDVLKAVDDETGMIVGHLVLSHRLKAESGKGEEEWKEGKREPPEGIVVEVFEEVMKFAAGTKVLTGKEHLELTHIYITPSHRRQGIGRKLVAFAVKKAKGEGLRLGAGVEPEAYAFFKAMGFRDTKAVDIDLRRWAVEKAGFGVFRFSGMVWGSEVE